VWDPLGLLRKKMEGGEILRKGGEEKEKLFEKTVSR
jgi:hypothetical protein